MGPDMASLGTSLFVFHGVLGALYHKWRTGEGQHVDVSMLGTLIHQRGITWLSTYDPEEWSGFYCEGDLKAPDYGYDAADQPIVMSSVRQPEELPRLLKALGLEEYTEHPLFQNTPREIMGWHGSTDLASQAKPHLGVCLQEMEGGRPDRTSERLQQHRGHHQYIHPAFRSSATGGAGDGQRIRSSQV